MFDRILLNNERFLITSGLLGGKKVTLKERNITRRALRIERLYLLEFLEEIKKNGVPIEPGNKLVEEIFEGFGDAIFSRYNARWQAYFTVSSPSETAKLYLKNYQPHETDPRSRRKEDQEVK